MAHNWAYWAAQAAPLFGALFRFAVAWLSERMNDRTRKIKGGDRDDVGA